MAENSQQGIIDAVGGVFEKAPALPKNARDVLVQIAPWIALIFGILGVLVGLGAIGISPVALFAGAEATTIVLISGVASVVSGGLMLLAFSGLKTNKMRGWNLLFWSEAVSLVSTVLSGSYVSGIIGALIGFYLLFQIRSYYK